MAMPRALAAFRLMTSSNMLDFGARRLARRLTALKIDHVHEEFEDDHYSTSYRFDVSFPRLFAALSEGG